MKDYEQLYYDQLYENKKLIRENKQLEEELKIYKKYSNSKDLKRIIIKEIIRYKEKKE